MKYKSKLPKKVERGLAYKISSASSISSGIKKVNVPEIKEKPKAKAAVKPKPKPKPKPIVKKRPDISDKTVKKYLKTKPKPKKPKTKAVAKKPKIKVIKPKSKTIVKKKK